MDIKCLLHFFWRNCHVELALLSIDSFGGLFAHSCSKMDEWRMQQRRRVILL